VSEKEQLALKTVKRYMLWSAGGALIPIPFVDIAAILTAQLKMLAEISKIYDIPFERSKVKAVIGSLLGYVLPETLSEGLFGSLLKTIPGVGALVGAPSFALFVAGYAWALGRVFIMHCESGGKFLDFDPEAVRAHFRAQFDEGQRMAGTIENGEKVEA
jgi:uncharacterized protein (DUF697 family)